MSLNTVYCVCASFFMICFASVAQSHQGQALGRSHNVPTTLWNPKSPWFHARCLLFSLEAAGGSLPPLQPHGETTDCWSGAPTSRWVVKNCRFWSVFCSFAGERSLKNMFSHQKLWFTTTWRKKEINAMNWAKSHQPPCWSYPNFRGT